MTGGNKVVQVWDLTTNQEPVSLTGHTAKVWAVACTVVDGHPVAVTSGNDNTLRIWDLTTNQAQATYAVPRPVFAVACTVVDGRPVAVTGDVGRHGASLGPCQQSTTREPSEPHRSGAGGGLYRR